ncbi:MAG: Gfo/Idh/MocA family oxidoreductase [Alphaproteobacteria bacterium]|nr:Gfo/Idh/MocA family oxidoreductase [Alphaproteobacteria bacterium]
MDKKLQATAHAGLDRPPVGAALIGLGEISEPHIHGLIEAREDVRFVAVCDISAERANAVAQRIGAKAYTDYRDILADPEIEAVDLPLPHHLHFEVASSALEAGKHVLLEKPMAPSIQECEALAALARRKGLTLGVAENTPFVPAYVEAKALLDSGALGTLRSVRTLISGSEVHRLRDTSNWKGRTAGSIGGAIFDAGPHSFFLLNWMFGGIATIRAVTAKLVEEAEVEDNALVNGRLNSGALFSSEFTFTAEIPWGERLEIYGSAGSIVIDHLLNPSFVHYRGGSDISGARGAADPDPKYWKARSIAAGVGGFMAAVRRGLPAPVSPQAGTDAIRAVMAAYESVSKGGLEVKLSTSSKAR